MVTAEVDKAGIAGQWPTGQIRRGYAMTGPRSVSQAVGRTARLLMREFPGWLCWYGTATHAWWALTPPDCWCPCLIEAATPAELALRIHEIRAAVGRGA
jgi:hypothetical protein